MLEGAWPQMFGFGTIWGDEESYLEYWRIIPPYCTVCDVATYDEDDSIAVLGRSGDVLIEQDTAWGQPTWKARWSVMRRWLKSL